MRHILAVLGLGLLLFSPAARAQLPDRPLRIIVPSPPGGTGDIVARLLADAVSARLPRGAVVDNRAGANGNIGMGEAQRGATDGSVLVQCAFGPCGATRATASPAGRSKSASGAPMCRTSVPVCRSTPRARIDSATSPRASSSKPRRICAPR